MILFNLSGKRQIKSWYYIQIFFELILGIYPAQNFTITSSCKQLYSSLQVFLSAKEYNITAKQGRLWVHKSFVHY